MFIVKQPEQPKPKQKVAEKTNKNRELPTLTIHENFFEVKEEGKIQIHKGDNVINIDIENENITSPVNDP
jgi:hypothetical protein